jgi:undecaprenyl-diphosphatase
MTTIGAVLLGLVQGLTEFLPVSSSAHLAAMKALLHVKSPGVVVEVALHVGTLLAILLVFRRELWEVARDGLVGSWVYLKGLGWAAAMEAAPRLPTAAAIVVGSVPAGFAGLLFRHQVERAFGSIVACGAFLMATGLFLLSSRLAPAKKADRMGVGRGFVVGIAQAVALLPGISRSGATIVTGCWLGVDRAAAGRFSFLLAVPAMAGAAVLELLEELRSGLAMPGGKDSLIQVGALAAGTLVAAVVGTLCLIFLLRVVERGRLHWFAAYCLPAGAVMLAAGLLR